MGKLGVEKNKKNEAGVGGEFKHSLNISSSGMLDALLLNWQN